MKTIILSLILSFTTLLQAQPFSKNNILGVWEVSSKKMQGFTSFGKEFSTTRGQSYILIFNKHGFVKNKTTGSIYNYEIINGKLKIYQTKIYKNNYKIKDKKHYDLWAITGSFENCSVAKIVKKKLTGYYRKDGYKFCKIQNYPQPTFQSEGFKF
ncbi:MAG: hypothetical protein L3J10_04230 [Sulfurimonas sp.]|nr:hypothetical protein [Sulfurimonas sp.]